MFKNIIIGISVLICSALTAIIVVMNLDNIVGYNNIWHPWVDQMVIFRDDLKRLFFITMCGGTTATIIIHILLHKNTKYFSLIFCALVGMFCSYEVVCFNEVSGQLLPTFNDRSLMIFLASASVHSCMTVYLLYSIKKLLSLILTSRA